MRIVLLEHPRVPSEAHFNDIANTPLWSCLMTGYAAASLSNAGFDVTILDATRRSFADTIELLTETPPDLLAVHAVYFWEETGMLFEMFSELRRKGYGGVICLFGFFPTLAWKDILEYAPAVDCVVVGEPEETLVELARAVEGGAVTPCSGLAARAGGKATLFGMRAPIEPLDRLPFPVRPSLESEETVSVLASRGCYNGCSFCLIPTLDGGRAVWRGRSAGNVAGEVAELVRQGKRNFYFVDPNFIGPGKAGKEGALRLSQALTGLGISFGMETRANDITAPLVKSLREAGLASLLLGIESGSPRVLKRLCKRTTVAQNERAITVVRETGIEPEIGFIMFDPASTLDDIIENVRFLERNELLGRLGRSANLLYHYHIAFKGTPGYAKTLGQGKLVPEGLFGFEGRMLYDDLRVGWLAGIMKPVCRFILREMGTNGSPIHWSDEGAGEGRFREVNDHFLLIFKEMLRTAENLTQEPQAVLTEALLNRALEQLERTLVSVCEKSKE